MNGESLSTQVISHYSLYEMVDFWCSVPAAALTLEKTEGCTFGF